MEECHENVINKDIRCVQQGDGARQGEAYKERKNSMIRYVSLNYRTACPRFVASRLQGLLFPWSSTPFNPASSPNAKCMVEYVKFVVLMYKHAGFVCRFSCFSQMYGRICKVRCSDV